MPSLVSGMTAVDAWKSAALTVLDAPQHRIRNLIIEIETPIHFESCWLQQYDPKSVNGLDRLSVVAKVLFPPFGREDGESREEYYSRWSAVLKRGRKCRNLHSSWGCSTYFERLLSTDGSENQLERAIKALFAATAVPIGSAATDGATRLCYCGSAPD